MLRHRRGGVFPAAGRGLACTSTWPRRKLPRGDLQQVIGVIRELADGWHPDHQKELFKEDKKTPLALCCAEMPCGFLAWKTEMTFDASRDAYVESLELLGCTFIGSSVG